ncbi:hypothetical protein HN682_08220 [Candidatus Peregrinibacteria bacterium]|jgi:hypothetical protein|nr:hypothetical protein [Candidatus Peregrinibacteria bacterium]
MSKPNPTAGLMDYMLDNASTYCEPMCSDSMELIVMTDMLEEEITNPKKRTELYDEYYDFCQEHINT